MKKIQSYDKKAWDLVQLSRNKERPQSNDYITNIFGTFIPLYGDRYFADDSAIIGGIATINDIPITVIGQQKGRTLEEISKNKNGMVSPEGYRKSLRLMKQAEKFNRPIINFIDTPGAFSGTGAEQRGQAWSISQNLLHMAKIKSPILSIIISSGGSGGALALAFANEVWMLENSYYSILSPEGFASILWKDASKAPLAANKMKSSAQELKQFKIIDKVIKEPSGGVHTNPQAVYSILQKHIIDFITKTKYGDHNSKNRIKKYNKMGKFISKEKKK